MSPSSAALRTAHAGSCWCEQSENPTAAHLCNGVDLAELGDLVDPGTLLPGMVPLARPEGDGIAAEVLWVDHFGNAQLNIGPEDIAGWGDRVRARFGDTTRAASLAQSYDGIGPGAIGLVVDSYGLLAVGLERQSAAAELGIGAGDAVYLEPMPDDDQTATPIVRSASVPFPQRRR